MNVFICTSFIMVEGGVLPRKRGLISNNVLLESFN